LQIAAGTADAAVSAVHLRPGETVLIGGAAGGVGVIAASLAAGDFQLPIQESFPIEKTLEALDLLRAGHVRGKLVVTI
jgi:NADPH:quinone reductase-like Zn-dependent oxidoreductase